MKVLRRWKSKDEIARETTERKKRRSRARRAAEKISRRANRER